MKPFTADQVGLGFIGVVVYDCNQSNAEALRRHGAVSADNLDRIAPSADVILSCLTVDNSVRDVYQGPDGILKHIDPSKVVLSRRKPLAKCTPKAPSIASMSWTLQFPAAHLRSNRTLSRCSPGATPRCLAQQSRFSQATHPPLYITELERQAQEAQDKESAK